MIIELMISGAMLYAEPNLNNDASKRADRPRYESENSCILNLEKDGPAWLKKYQIDYKKYKCTYLVKENRWIYKG